MKLFIFLIAIIAALSIVSVASADKRTLSYSPNPANVGDSLVFSGCGYGPREDLLVQAIHNTKFSEEIVQIQEFADSNGCFSTSDFPYTIQSSGKWVANVYDYNSAHKLSTLFFTVN
jgi:hypothetical protein